MEQIGPGGIDWRRWKRDQFTLESEIEDGSDIRFDILSLRRYVNLMREERLSEELRSNVKILWQIGCDVLRRYKCGDECIEMMGMLAFFASTAVDARVFESEENRNLILMLMDLGFVTMTTQSPTNTSISTEFPALMDEIQMKNLQINEKTLEKIFVILDIYSSNFGIYPYSQKVIVMTPIWHHALTYGIKFIRDYNSTWGFYLDALLLDTAHRLTTEEKQILSRAVEIFIVEYGAMDSRTMKLRLTQLSLLLREEGVESFLNVSSNYRPILETILMTTDDPLQYLLYWTSVRVEFPVERPIARVIYEKALQTNDLKSKTLLLEEALAYCILGNNVWRSTLPDSNEDKFFGLSLKCFAALGRTDQMVAFVRKMREILMDHGFMPWFAKAVSELAQEIDGKEGILNELSILYIHLFNIGITTEDLMEGLIKCESDLKNWDRLLVIMREKRQNWILEHISLDKLTQWVKLELFMFDLVKNSMNDQVGELVNESLEFLKQLVEYLLIGGAYGEKYLVNSSSISRFKYDPLVVVIRICLLTNRHEELLSYMLEYEKMLEDKYGERFGPITNGILLFGEWTTVELENHNNTGKKLKEFLLGVKTMIQNWMSLILSHPTEKKSWMEGYADLISKNCDTYLVKIEVSI